LHSNETRQRVTALKISREIQFHAEISGLLPDDSSYHFSLSFTSCDFFKTEGEFLITYTVNGTPTQFQVWVGDDSGQLYKHDEYSHNGHEVPNSQDIQQVISFSQGLYISAHLDMENHQTGEILIYLREGGEEEFRLVASDNEGDQYWNVLRAEFDK
jgi:hypothetical protein